MSLDLSIVIVSWNVAGLLHDCLQAILAPATEPDQSGVLHLGKYSIEVYVVDNASSDDSKEMVRETFPQVRLIVNPTNVGFTKANNVALEICRGRYLLLLNPDTRVVDDALVRMLDYMEAHPDVGVLGPQLRYGGGSLQSSRRRFPTLATAFFESTLLHQWFPTNHWAQAYKMADTPDDLVQDVDWVVGACMLVRAEAVGDVGLLDERFFMYSEEMDWCRRIVEAGWRVVYYPEAVVVHYEGRSTDQVVASRHVNFERSKILYFGKHHGRTRATILRGFLLATYALQLTEEGLKFLVGHKRALRRERVVAYAQVLRSGLRLPGDRRGPDPQ
jgi:N-acetylglucosaminyl-diphospho-decaprenol L-rhamnosyltransferase